MQDLRTNKKANLEDWGMMGWVLLSLIMSVFFVNLILYNFNDKVQGLSVSNDALTVIEESTTKAISFLDAGILIMYLVMLIIILYSAYYINSNIKFAIIGFLYIIMTIWLFPILTQIGLGILTANTVTQVIADLMPRSYWILNNLTLIQVITWLLVMIMLYAKTKNKGEDSGVSGSI